MPTFTPPTITNKTELLMQLNFIHALITATEGLLDAANMPSKGEKGHAEWLYRDIINLGGIPTRCDHDAARLAGAQYYYIYHIDPKMLLGYRAALESAPTPLSVVDQLEEAYGPLPCIRHHSEVDPSHFEQVQKEINAITDLWLRQQIETNYYNTLTTIQTVLHTRTQILRHYPGMELVH